MRRPLLFILIFLSGVAGLMYEIVWHRYLAILLGAQARATAIVLAIFLGGISAGYAVFGKWSRDKKWNLLKAYSLVELGLFVWAFAFPYLFKLARPLTASLYGFLGVSNLLIDIFVSVLLIGVPTFLMGGTLPLLTQGMSEDLGEASQTHARIYGINTVGACLGSLIAGFYLIPKFGFHFTVWTAGNLNLLIAAVVYYGFARNQKTVQSPATLAATEAPASSVSRPRMTGVQKAILGIGFLSGFYVLTLQTVLIRLTGLSTGASNYNFTLIVSIFIFGLGMGSLAARNIKNYSTKRLIWNQAAIVLSFWILYLVGGHWPYIVHVIRAGLRDIPQAFVTYQFLLGVSFTLMLAIPVGLAGLCLPLCFHLLKDKQETLGFRVGQLYGINTLGCVMGALIGGYGFFFFLNLDVVFKICVYLAALSTLLAVYVWVETEEELWAKAWAPLTVMSIGFVGVLLAGGYTPDRFTQPFRHQAPLDNVTFEGPKAFYKHIGRSTDYLLFRDGPNTTLGVGASSYEGKEVSRTIFVNGKSDGNTRGDFFTTIMLGHIPGLLARKLENVAVVGFGTGITIGTIALYPEVKNIEVIEIEREVLKNKVLYDEYNGSDSKNTKVRYNEMHAFRFLEGSDKKFDIVISEPSNPWVAGVENLYSSEFYETAKNKMSPDGLFVQWIHTYSFTNDLLRMVLKTMSTQFAHLSVFTLRGGDLAVLGTNTPIDRSDLKRGEKRYKDSPIIAKSLQDGGVERYETIFATEIVPFSLGKLIGESAAVHTLDAPKLSNDAARAFFSNTAAQLDSLRRQYKAYYPAVADSMLIDYLNGRMASKELLESFKHTFCEAAVSKHVSRCDETLAALRVYSPREDISGSFDQEPNARDIASLGQFQQLRPKNFTNADLNDVYVMFETYKKYHSPIAYLNENAILNRLERCLAVTEGKQELFGECLLQKILVLEGVRLRGAEFKEAVGTYLRWFQLLPKTAKNYAKLHEARDLLLKIADVEQADGT